MGILEWAIIIIVLLWLSGWLFAIGGGFIHLLLIIALVLLIYRLVKGQ